MTSPLVLPAEIAAAVSAAERAVQHLNTGGPVLANPAAFARLLLRLESLESFDLPVEYEPLAGDPYSPVVEAALAYAQVGPGLDGRATVQTVLRQRGLAPRYVPAIARALAMDADARPASDAPWIASFAAATTRAADDAEQLARLLDALVEGWRRQAHPLRKHSAADLLLGHLPAEPSLTVASAAALTGRTFQAADAAVSQLVHAGVLRQTTRGHRNRTFEVVGLAIELARFERQLASPEWDLPFPHTHTAALCPRCAAALQRIAARQQAQAAAAGLSLTGLPD